MQNGIEPTAHAAIYIATSIHDTSERRAAQAKCATAYYAMKEADAEYSIALVKMYSHDRAGDMRYQTSKQPYGLRVLGQRAVDAAEVWSAAFRAIPA